MITLGVSKASLKHLRRSDLLSKSSTNSHRVQVSHQTWSWVEYHYLVNSQDLLPKKRLSTLQEKSLLNNGPRPHVDLSFLTCTTNVQDDIGFIYNQSVIINPTTCLQHCILVPTNTQVNRYNTAVLSLLPSTSRQYLVADLLEEHTEATEAINSDLDTNSPLPNPDAILDYV